MATDPAHRGVSIDRVTAGRFTARNDRGGRIAIGTGDDADFTPSELLLAALGGCTAIDVDILTSRVVFPPGEGGDAARAVLPDAVRRSHDQLCTVSRTIELGIPVTSRVQAG